MTERELRNWLASLLAVETVEEIKENLETIVKRLDMSGVKL